MDYIIHQAIAPLVFPPLCSWEREDIRECFMAVHFSEKQILTPHFVHVLNLEGSIFQRHISCRHSIQYKSTLFNTNQSRRCSFKKKFDRLHTVLFQKKMFQKKIRPSTHFSCRRNFERLECWQHTCLKRNLKFRSNGKEEARPLPSERGNMKKSQKESPT